MHAITIRNYYMAFIFAAQKLSYRIPQDYNFSPSKLYLHSNASLHRGLRHINYLCLHLCTHNNIIYLLVYI